MEDTNTDILFRPLTVGSLTLKNRIVMAPMTRSFAPGGIPVEASAAYYRRRAEGQVGLILSEGTVVNRPASRNDPNVPSFYGDAALAGWQRVIDAVHSEGGRMGPQLWHTGSTKAANWEPDVPVESPSGLLDPNTPRGEAMSDQAIADTIVAFADSAANAKLLGFDTLEIHGAHGYLIDQFFWSGTNRRTDRYGGGTIKERTKFASEIIAAVRAAVGPTFPISMRISQWKGQDYTARIAETPQLMEEWLAPLVEAGADILHCSQRRYWEPEFPEVDGAQGLNFAGWAKKITGKTTISVGSVGLSGDMTGAFRGEASHGVDLHPLIERMERDEFDLIAVGRALIGDPHWVLKVQGRDPEPMKGFDPTSLKQLV